MNKKITIALAILALLLIGGIAYLYTSLDEQKKVNQDMQELAELDKKEMQNEYEKFAQQYSEMKNQINNDSIVAQLTQEQLRTQQLLQELKNVKATDAREITRLKKELATCRAIIRSYVLEIDSLNRLNQNLTAENTRVKGQYEEATRQIEGLNAEKTSLTEKVAIAAQGHQENQQGQEPASQFQHRKKCHCIQRRQDTIRENPDTHRTNTYQWRYLQL